MYGAPVSAPKFWKAALTAAVFCLPVTLLVRAFVPMSDLIWILVAFSSTLVVASIVHARVCNDWRAQDTMDSEVFDRRTSVAPNVRTDKENWR